MSVTYLNLEEVQTLKDLGDHLHQIPYEPSASEIKDDTSYQMNRITEEDEEDEENESVSKMHQLTKEDGSGSKMTRVSEEDESVSKMNRITEGTEVIKEDDHQTPTEKKTGVKFAESVKQNSVDDMENKPKKKKKDLFYEDVNEYLCANPDCQYLEKKDDLVQLHLYEVDSYNIIVICNYCYDSNYRFCLFSHEVKPMSELEPVFENMYAQPHLHMGQLHPDIISSVPDIDNYLQSIGIENPCPNYSVIDLWDQDSDLENLDD